MKPLFELEETLNNLDWKVLKIKRVLEIPITDGPHETPEILEEGIPFLSAESVKKGKLNFGLKRGYISSEDYEKYIKKCKPQRNDIFMVKSGATTGNVAMVETDEEFSIWSPLALIRANQEKVLPRYLYYFIDSLAFREQVEISWSYGTQQNIGMKVIENLFISLPPLFVQSKLVNYIEKKVFEIDNLVTEKEKLIKLLEENRQSIITEVVTKGLNPNVKMKDSGVEWIGEVPEHWKIVKLKYLTKMKSGESIDSLDINSEGQYKVYGGGGFRGYTSKYTHTGEYLLIGRQGALCGNVTFASGEFWATEHAVVVETNYVDIRFLGYLLEGMNLNQYSISAAQPGLSVSTILNLAVPMPAKNEQIELAAKLEEINVQTVQLISDIQGEIQKLKEYRQSLIYEAVTGKIDVRDFEVEVE
ncbi:type I restriction endonuclease subunit S [Bacillaceae bacterium SAS-127]|nr:type I restriction endonuclease subunit S [Bacillaceae bacterium SAS-127]